jgi:hypothetical protein
MNCSPVRPRSLSTISSGIVNFSPKIACHGASWSSSEEVPSAVSISSTSWWIASRHVV